MGDSSVVEFLRDLSIIIAVGVGGISLFILTVAALVLYKKLNRTLSALQGTAENAQEASRALLDNVIKPVTGNAAASHGAGRAAGFLFGFMRKRGSKGKAK